MNNLFWCLFQLSTLLQCHFCMCISSCYWLSVCCNCSWPTAHICAGSGSVPVTQSVVRWLFLKATRTEISLVVQCYQAVLRGLSGVMEKRKDVSCLIGYRELWAGNQEMTQFLVNTSSSAIILVCVHTSARRHKYFPLAVLYQWNNLMLDALFAHILALGHIPLCSSELFLETHNGGRGEVESTMLDNRSYRLAPLSLS